MEVQAAEVNRSSHDICGQAWEKVQARDKRALIGFTAGVLKLWPADQYWTDVVQALAEGRWRVAEQPLGYIRRVAVQIAKKRKRELARGSYAGDRNRPVTSIEIVPESQLSGPCWVRVEKGRWLDEPKCLPPQLVRTVMEGQIELFSPTRAVAPEGNDLNTVQTNPLDKADYRYWWEDETSSRASRLPSSIHWPGVALLANLDREEVALLRAMLSTNDEAEMRVDLGWPYARFERVRKRLRRKYGLIGRIILQSRKFF